MSSTSSPGNATTTSTYRGGAGSGRSRRDSGPVDGASRSRVMRHLVRLGAPGAGEPGLDHAPAPQACHHEGDPLPGDVAGEGDRALLDGRVGELPGGGDLGRVARHEFAAGEPGHPLLVAGQRPAGGLLVEDLLAPARRLLRRVRGSALAVASRTRREPAGHADEQQGHGQPRPRPAAAARCAAAAGGGHGRSGPGRAVPAAGRRPGPAAPADDVRGRCPTAPRQHSSRTVTTAAAPRAVRNRASARARSGS